MIIEDDVDPEWTLLFYLRSKLRLCGTKLVCAEGGCGACTVMVSKYDRQLDKITHLPVNACLAPVCAMHGLAITTVEGIGSTKTRLHPVQERIAKAHGSQCGFCTPGIVMSMYALLRSMPKPSMKDMEVAFQGNLCRCTGYRPIIEGYKTFTEDWELMQTSNKLANGNGCGMGDKCCKLNQKSEISEDTLFKPSEFVPYDTTQEPIFPPELKVSDTFDQQSLYFQSKNVGWFRPNKLTDLLDLKNKYQDSKIIAGNTEIGVEVKFKNCIYPTLIQPSQILEMNCIKTNNDGIQIGASMSLHDIEEELKQQIANLPEYKTRIFKGIVDMLQLFAGKQIRCVASIGGNIMTGSPISDLNPIFMATNIELELQSIEGVRRIRMDEHFFTGYRKNIIRKNEVLISISIPFTKENQYFYAYKQARRKDDDIAIVNCAINVWFKDTNVIEDINLAFGGMAPTTILALQTKKNLIGLRWDINTLEKAYSYLLDDLPLASNAPGGMIEYRKTLPLSFIFKAFLTINQKLPNRKIDPKDLSAIKEFDYKIPQSTQFFEIVPETREKSDTIGRPVVHMSAFKQATGEAVYCDDLPSYENELSMAFVYSTEAHAELIQVDESDALQIEGVVGFISAKDLTESTNKLGPVVQDEEVFISKIVTSRYQIIGAILAEDCAIAKRAAKAVKIIYKKLQPVIVSIEDAIRYDSYFEVQRKLTIGDVDEVFRKAKHVLEGECRTGYQEHFYFETHGALVVPKENELEIISSTQHHAEITDFVSRVLNIPQNRIVTRVKRIGGGFGGKQSRGVLISVPAAIAAVKYNRPVRIMLDRDEDMAMSGGRHPYVCKYKVAFEETGKITGYEIDVFANGGCTSDLSVEVLDRAVFHVENTYKIPNLRVIGKICKTNLPSNTAFRGFGAPQAMFAAENMIRDVAEYLRKDPTEISIMNLYKEADITHYNQRILNCNLKKCVEECLESSYYFNRKNEVNKYNSNNRWKKRGISMVSTKYGIGFGVPFLEQAGSLVHVYTDGSVLLTHSGVEMGQGLNTKMIQVASRVLEIPVEMIHISECATDKVPNTSPSAASVGSDLNGMAVLRACEIIKDRMKPIKEKNPKGTWKDWALEAYMNRISLSATGYFCTPDIVYDWKTNTGSPYNYYTYGAACTEVEIDCLTGDHRVLRTDIVMDLGASLNPAIDIGQIEGAFMQGYGLFVLEEMVYSPQGEIFTKGPGSYKIPGFYDIPIEFNVSLLKGASNPRAVYSSKAVGEPPLFLASSALFAIREAIKSARADAGLNESFRLNAPATSAKIRMACQDSLTAKVLETTKDGQAWNIIP